MQRIRGTCCPGHSEIFLQRKPDASTYSIAAYPLTSWHSLTRSLLEASRILVASHHHVFVVPHIGTPWRGPVLGSPEDRPNGTLRNPRQLEGGHRNRDCHVILQRTWRRV